MLRVSFSTLCKTRRLSFFCITKISFALAYGTIPPSLVHLQKNVCKCQNITREKQTNTQNLMEVIVASLILTKWSSVEDLSYIPHVTIFHVFLTALRQCCLFQCTCFSPSPLKIPFPNCAKHISPGSLNLQWLHKSIRVKNNLGEESRGKCGAGQGHKGLADLLKSSKGNYFISCSINYPSREIPRIYSSEKHVLVNIVFSLLENH